MQLRITPAGRAALINAQGTGTESVVVAEIGLTETAFDPAVTNVLPNELKRVDTFGGVVVDAETIHVNMQDATADAYTLRGLAVYLDDGTVFGIAGDVAAGNHIIQKSAAAQVMLSVDVKLADLTTANITFSGGGFTNPTASETVLGVLRLASMAQAIDGLNDANAMTPATSKAQIDGRFGVGAPSGFVKGLLGLATAVLFRAALAIKDVALKDEGHTASGVGINADMVDGVHASGFATIGHTHTIANVAGLQATLDGKSNVGHVHAIGEITGLQVAIDGKSNVGHVHAIANVTGLQSALDAKASLTGAAFTGTVSAPLFNGTAAQGSSLRYKEDLLEIDPAEAMRLLRSLRWWTYRLKRDGRRSAGVVAEHLAETEFDFVVLRDRHGRPDAVDYQPLYAIASAAVLDIDRRLRALERAQ